MAFQKYVDTLQSAQKAQMYIQHIYEASRTISTLCIPASGPLFSTARR